MNISFVIPFLLYLLTNTMTKTIKTIKTKPSLCTQYCHSSLRNMRFKCIIFKEKNLPKLCNELKKTSKIYHNKTIVIAAECFSKYSQLSEEDKLIIENIIDLLY